MNQPVHEARLGSGEAGLSEQLEDRSIASVKDRSNFKPKKSLAKM